jgi:hypothetical protein
LTMVWPWGQGQDQEGRVGALDMNPLFFGDDMAALLMTSEEPYQAEWSLNSFKRMKEL